MNGKAWRPLREAMERRESEQQSRTGGFSVRSDRGPMSERRYASSGFGRRAVRGRFQCNQHGGGTSPTIHTGSRSITRSKMQRGLKSEGGVKSCNKEVKTKGKETGHKRVIGKKNSLTRREKGTHCISDQLLRVGHQSLK